MTLKVLKQLSILFVLFLGISSSAFAHSEAGASSGFISGLMHPIGGLDHVAAMVAVGLWGAFLGRPAIWLLPVVFPLVMAFGGVLGLMNFPIPAVETGIAASAIVLGLVVLFAIRAPLWIAAVLVAFFAIFHGYAHGQELPTSANPLAYSIGFVISTGVLHMAGIALGMLTKLPKGDWIIRAAGGVIAAGGVGFLTGTL